jgi:hypothetical protein
MEAPRVGAEVEAEMMIDDTHGAIETVLMRVDDETEISIAVAGALAHDLGALIDTTGLVETAVSVMR